MFGTKLPFSREEIFGPCSREELERLEWKKGNFCSFFFGQHRTAKFSLVFFLVGVKPNIKTC